MPNPVRILGYGVAMLTSLHLMAAMPSSAPVAPVKPYIVKSENGDRQDPYYWLRDDKRQAPDVLAYLNAENQYYQQYADQYKSLSKSLADEIIGRIKQDDSTVPVVKGDYSYYTRYEQGKEYPIYARKPKAGGAEQVMLNVNELAKGKDFYQIGNYQVSPDQQLLAYAEDTTGRRNYNLKVRDLRTGKDLTTTITGAEASIAWSADNSQLFYIEKDPQTLLGTKVRRHTLGQAVAKDEVLYEEKDSSFYMGVGNSADEKFVVIWLGSTVSNEMLVLKSDDKKGKFTAIAPRQRDFKYEVEHIDNRWVIMTDWDAPNYRLMTVNDDKIGDRSRWQPLLAHDDNIFIQGFALFNDYLAISERSDGLRRIRVMPWQAPEKAFYVKSDEAAYVTGFEMNAEQNTPLLRYTYTSLTTPASVYQLNMATGERTLLKQQEVLGDFDKADEVVDRTEARAEIERPGALLDDVHIQIPAAGHLTAVEDPDAVSHALLGWLALAADRPVLAALALTALLCARPLGGRTLPATGAAT